MDRRVYRDRLIIMRLNNGVVGQMTGIAEKEEGAWDETLAVADCVREQVAARWQNFRKLAIPPSMLAARQPGPRKTSLEEQAKKLQEQKRIQQGKEMRTRLVATAEEEQAKASKAAQKAAKKVEKTRKAQESLAETVSHAQKHAKQHILPRDSSEDDADVAGKAQRQAWQAALLQMSRQTKKAAKEPAYLLAIKTQCEQNAHMEQRHIGESNKKRQH